MRRSVFGRFLATFLVLAMVLSILPVSFAATGSDGFEEVGTSADGTFTDTTAAEGQTYEYYIEGSDGTTTAVREVVNALPAYSYDGTVTTATAPFPDVYVLDTDGVDAGSAYLIVGANNDNYALYHNTTTIGAQAVTITDNTIDIDGANGATWTFSGTTSGTIKNGTYYLSRNSSTLTASTSSTTWTISNQGSGLYSIYASKYYIRYSGSNFTSMTKTATNVRLFKATPRMGTYYMVDTSGYEALLVAIDAEVQEESAYLSGYAAYTAARTAAEAANTAVANPYTAEADANTAQSNLNAAVLALYNAYNDLVLDTNTVKFKVVGADASTTTQPAYLYEDYNSGSVEGVNNADGTVTATATADSGNRFCYWTKRAADGTISYVGNNAVVSAESTETATYYAWFIAEQADGSIRVPILWQRSDEVLGGTGTYDTGTKVWTKPSSITDTDGDGSYVLAGIPTYATYPSDWITSNVYYGTQFTGMLDQLKVADDAYVWDFEKSGTDSDSQTYQYGSYTNNNSYEPSVIAATWKDKDATTGNDEWKYGSARMFRGTFYWPEGYTAADISKMISVNDSNYAFIYDYVETHITELQAAYDALVSGGTATEEEIAAALASLNAYKSAFENGSVIPINDDMFVFIHKASEDLTGADASKPMVTGKTYADYMDFFTGTTGKGVWSQKGNTNADWGKTTETLLGEQSSVRAFRWSYPNLVSANANVVSFESVTGHLDYGYSLQHTDGWYTFLNTNTLASRLSSLYGATTTFGSGEEFNIDIYVVDNSGSGGMDKMEISFNRSPVNVTVNYYLDSVTTTADADHFLGSATITGSFVDDEITLGSGTAAAQLNYYYAAAIAKLNDSTKACSNGEQQGVIPYVVVAADNVINVLYVSYEKSGLVLRSNNSTYVYNGQQKNATGLTLVVDGVSKGSGVYTQSTDTYVWNFTAQSYNVRVTYKGATGLTGTVYGTYVGTYPNTISNAGLTIQYYNNGQWITTEDFVLGNPISGNLTITPSTVTVTYDYGLNNTFSLPGIYDPADTIVLDTYTYAPAAIYSGTAVAQAVDKNGDNTTDYTVNIIPATTVLYEAENTNFVTQSTVSAGWTINGTAADPTVTDNGSTVYGYSAAYASQAAAASNGAALKATVTPANKYAYARFTFTGTGFDILGATGPNTGSFIAMIEKDGAVVDTLTVDTYYGYTWSGDTPAVNDNATDVLYNVPVMNWSTDTYGTYVVTIAATYIAQADHNHSNSDDIYLDAIRIYNAMGTSSNAAYLAANEDQPTFIELRDEIIGDSDYVWVKDTETDLWTYVPATDPTGVVGDGLSLYIDGNNDVAPTAYVGYQPNNEIYLKPGNSVAFALSADAAPGKVMLSAKSFDGAALSFTVNGITFTAVSCEDMYYDITAAVGTWTLSNGKYVSPTITISNPAGENVRILSLGYLKLTKAAAKSANVNAKLFVTDETVQDALDMITLNPGYLAGDANCDGAVDAADAAAILRASVGLIELTKQGVFNASIRKREVSALNAAQVLRFTVGLIVSLDLE